MFRILSTAILTALVALPAGAQLAPEEVWQAWRSGTLDMEAAGRRMEGDALVLDGVTATLPQGGRLLVDRVVMTPDGDAVRVRAAPEARLSVPGERGEGALSAPGASLSVTGRPGALVHALDVPALSLDWPATFGLALALDALTGRIETGARGIAAALSADGGTLDIAIEGAAGRSAARQVWTAPSLDYDGPVSPSPSSPAESRFTTEGTRIVSETENGTLRLDSGRTETEATLAGERIALSHLSRDSRAVIAPGPGAMPDIEADIAALELDIDGPRMPGDAAGPAALALSLDGVSLRDETWARLDPDGVLPRDPAALALDLRATLAPESRLSAPAPRLSFDRIEIDRASIDALDAAMRATGTLVFPDAPASGAPPHPEGVIDLTLENAAGLIDDLAAAGILAEVQALFARLGLAQVTRPGESDTSRVAEIVFGPDGSISVGGLTLR